jgi:hypothetical protein
MKIFLKGIAILNFSTVDFTKIITLKNSNIMLHPSI